MKNERAWWFSSRARKTIQCCSAVVVVVLLLLLLSVPEVHTKEPQKGWHKRLVVFVSDNELLCLTTQDQVCETKKE